MKFLTYAAASAALACLPSTAAAWGQQGHMMVAAVAWELMDGTARCNAGKLLATMTDEYGQWTAGVPAQYHARTAFLRASNWPDNIRGRYTDDGYDPVEPQARQNIGYCVDKLVHAYLHFRDEPFIGDRELTDAEKVQFAPAKPNAQSRIEDFSVALSDSADDRVRAYDLAWLIHLVGDVHQPLHATARLTPGSGGQLRGDSGGNFVQVCVDYQRCKSVSQTLHSFWDKVVGGSGDTRQATLQATPLYARARAATPEPSPAVWVDESFRAAKEKAYTSRVGVERKTYYLNAAYRREALNVAHERIALGGARLAALLNQRLNQPCSST
jgi:hypothetical protein